MTNTDSGMTNSPGGILGEMHGKYKSWNWVAIRLKDQSGVLFDRALLSRVGAGRQKAPNSLRAALGLPVLAPAPCCPDCAIPHLAKRCPAKRKASGKPRTDWKGRAMAASWAAVVLMGRRAGHEG